jgi:hypothetical protein
MPRHEPGGSFHSKANFAFSVCALSKSRPPLGNLLPEIASKPSQMLEGLLISDKHMHVSTQTYLSSQVAA